MCPDNHSTGDAAAPGDEHVTAIDVVVHLDIDREEGQDGTNAPAETAPIGGYPVTDDGRSTPDRRRTDSP